MPGCGPPSAGCCVRRHPCRPAREPLRGPRSGAPGRAPPLRRVRQGRRPRPRAPPRPRPAVHGRRLPEGAALPRHRQLARLHTARRRGMAAPSAPSAPWRRTCFCDRALLLKSAPWSGAGTTRRGRAPRRTRCGGCRTAPAPDRRQPRGRRRGRLRGPGAPPPWPGGRPPAPLPPPPPAAARRRAGCRCVSAAPAMDGLGSQAAAVVAAARHAPAPRPIRRREPTKNIPGGRGFRERPEPNRPSLARAGPRLRFQGGSEQARLPSGSPNPGAGGRPRTGQPADALVAVRQQPRGSPAGAKYSRSPAPARCLGF